MDVRVDNAREKHLSCQIDHASVWPDSLLHIADAYRGDARTHNANISSGGTSPAAIENRPPDEGNIKEIHCAPDVIVPEPVRRLNV